MALDVVDLRDFYASPLGRTAQRLIGQRLRRFWPDVRGLRVLGLGYATPFLGLFRGEAERTLALMPAAQGVLHWPSRGTGLTALGDPMALPFADRSMDRVLLVHHIEDSGAPSSMLREIWRVLADGGRLLIVAPNRRGMWAPFDVSPFGTGLPYSAGQMAQLLRANMFTPLATEGALFVPPVASRFILSTAGAWERVGTRFFSHFGGVIAVEAMKQLYAASVVETARERRPFLVAMPGGVRRG